VRAGACAARGNVLNKRVRRAEKTFQSESFNEDLVDEAGAK
jgi:hypothetical protein